ncbi:sulfotransferase family 2 domain-containing protein [Ruegeria profundi]|uniref:sulfotransferase family 2 domain-containing protein n=1 Tax=Ruegeria profundi TaxID=1685378 RepID=UPI001CD4A15A|nr:sulfotransferase family 2 domain-containing protein [Ruegeria profundi]MCA0929927.1 sulfotransferase family protein [Ruegeria profundi]
MVLVCHKHKFIYLKTTKTAGTSTEKALQPLCEKPGLGELPNGEVRISKHGIVGARGPRTQNTHRILRLWHRHKHPWRNHMSAMNVRENLGAKTFDSYTKIANVRDPFDRVVSQFHFMKYQKNLPSEDAKTEFEQFRSFVLSGTWSIDWDIVSIDNKLIVDRFIRKEHLVADLKETLAGFGLPENGFKLGHDKSMKERRKGIPVPDYYDPETIDVVRRNMAWVFNTLGYPDQPQH